MFAHRFREQLRLVTAGPVITACQEAAFVACPGFATFAHGQQSLVQAIYRVAAERTNAQLKAVRRRSRVPQFSVN